jgi:hypothetical protein
MDVLIVLAHDKSQNTKIKKTNKFQISISNVVDPPWLGYDTLDLV